MARKSKRRKLKSAYLFIVDGESEKNYLNILKQSNIHIEPLFSKKSLQELYNLFKNSISNQSYQQVYWIVDLDILIKENKIGDLKNYKRNYPQTILINNPCLEYWFLLHFENKRFDTYKCEKVISYLRRSFPVFKDYNKSEKTMQKIVNHLRTFIDTAITNAKSQQCDLDQLPFCSEMYRLFEDGILS